MYRRCSGHSQHVPVLATAHLCMQKDLLLHQCLAVSASWADASIKTSTHTHSFVAMLFISSHRSRQAILLLTYLRPSTRYTKPNSVLIHGCTSTYTRSCVGAVCSHQHVCLHGMPVRWAHKASEHIDWTRHCATLQQAILC